MILAIFILATLGNILIGLLVYLKNPKSSTNIFFGLLTLFIALWSSATYFSLNTTDSGAALFWIRLSMALAVFFALFFFYLMKSFPGSILKLPRWFFISWTGLAILASLAGISPFVFTSLTFQNGVAQPNPGPGMLLFIPSAIGSNVLGIFFILKKFFKSKGLERTQILYIMLGALTMIFLILLSNFVLVTLFKNNNFLSFTSIYTLTFLGATAYAIARHRLLDIRLVVARAVAYTLIVLIIGIFFTGSTLIVTSLIFKTSTRTEQLLLYTFLTLIITFTFQKLRRITELATDKIFFKEDYDSNIFLSSLTKTMAEIILIDDIAHQLLKKLIEEMRITRGAFVLTDGGKIFVSETQGYKKEPQFSEKEIFSIQALDKDLIFEDLEEGPAKDLMRKLSLTVVIPLKTQVDHVGILLLGEKQSGEIYSEKDIKVLEIFAPEAAISFENAKSVEKIRRFNITLKEQVERATKELRGANDQLKELDRLKDEFLSVASHDLRTPMTAIKGYLWMAINGRAGEIKNDQLKRYLEISYSSAERMIQLINDLLNVSRIKAGRMQMVFENLPLKPIIDQVFAEIMSKATEKSIDLTYKEEGKIPNVIIDKQRIPEVLQNLIGNALKFTPEKGKITVITKQAAEKGFIAISVSDTGVGLSKEDAGKLFEKYGRIEHSYSAAKTTGGTGLGLYITKNYVDMLGGKIWVDSTPGKGTTFTFTIKEFSKEAFEKAVKDSNKNEPSATIPKPNVSMAVEATRSSVPVR